MENTFTTINARLREVNAYANSSPAVNVYANHHDVSFVFIIKVKHHGDFSHELYASVTPTIPMEEFHEDLYPNKKPNKKGLTHFCYVCGDMEDRE